MAAIGISHFKRLIIKRNYALLQTTKKSHPQDCCLGDEITKVVVPPLFVDTSPYQPHSVQPEKYGDYLSSITGAPVMISTLLKRVSTMLLRGLFRHMTFTPSHQPELSTKSLMYVLFSSLLFSNEIFPILSCSKP